MGFSLHLQASNGGSGHVDQGPLRVLELVAGARMKVLEIFKRDLMGDHGSPPGIQEHLELFQVLWG